MNTNAKTTQVSSIGQLLEKYQVADKNKYISAEFQDYGYRLAVELDDIAHKSIYMRLSKREPRALLEQALSFVKDSGAKRPGALFMWKLKQLKKNLKEESSK